MLGPFRIQSLGHASIIFQVLSFRFGRATFCFVTVFHSILTTSCNLKFEMAFAESCGNSPSSPPSLPPSFSPGWSPSPASSFILSFSGTSCYPFSFFCFSCSCSFCFLKSSTLIRFLRSSMNSSLHFSRFFSSSSLACCADAGKLTGLTTCCSLYTENSNTINYPFRDGDLIYNLSALATRSLSYPCFMFISDYPDTSLLDLTS